MRKILIVAMLCLCGTMLFAQRDNVFYKEEADTSDINDTLPPFKKACFGFYFTPALTYNRGIHVAPLPSATLPGGPTTGSISYTGNGAEKPGFSFSFGSEYESKPFLSRLFYSLGLEFTDYKYYGSATLAIVSPSYGINTVETVPYSWAAISIDIPAELHIVLVKKLRYRFDFLLGVAPGLFLSQTYINQSYPTYDSFKSLTYSGILGLDFEYHLGGSFILKVQPEGNFLGTKTPQGRALETFGIELGLVFK